MCVKRNYMKDDVLLIRADASKDMGHGHVMRCIALAQEWVAHGGKAYIASKSLRAPLVRRLNRLGVEIFELPEHDDANKTLALAYYLDARWIVVDGYQFSEDYLLDIVSGNSPATPSVMCIDDTGIDGWAWVDIILNQNPHASQTMYSTYSKLLLGTEYVLLREEFKYYRGWNHPISPRINNVLIALGGEASESGIEKITDIVLQSIPNPMILALSGDLDCVSSAMAWADMAISAAGSTMLELAFMGVPTIGVFGGKQEELLLCNMSDRGCAINLGAYGNMDELELRNAVFNLARNQQLRQELSASGHALIDGYGAERIVKEMLNE